LRNQAALAQYAVGHRSSFLGRFGGQDEGEGGEFAGWVTEAGIPGAE